MNAFSTKAQSPSLGQLVALAEIVRSTSPEQRKEAYLERRYSNAETNFQLSLSYLRLLGFISIQSGIIRTKGAFDSLIQGAESINLPAFRQLVINELLSKSEVLGLDDFYCLFEKADRDMVLNLSFVERLKYSEPRNLLLELGVIRHIADKDLYKVESAFIPHFTNANKHALRRRRMGEEQFLKRLEDQKRLGSEAEMLILQYEKERLAQHPRLICDIEHTAKEDVGAGYDILSWETNGAERRYIEVKATPLDNYRFYWSDNEIRAAMTYGDRYFLYLLPVSNNQLDLNNLQTIQSPYNAVFLCPTLWTKTAKTYKIEKRLDDEK